MAAMAGMLLYERMLEDYQKMHFLKGDGSYNQTTIVQYTTDLLIQKGLKNVQEPQQVAGVWIYPWDYFCAIMYETGTATFTDNTRSIHHYSSSWLSVEERRIQQFEAMLHRKFGVQTGRKLGRIMTFPYRCARKLREKGAIETFRFAITKVRKK